MDAVVASLVAVGGTLAGAALTFAFSFVTARRSQRIARAERLHQELQAACAAFAAAANQMRRCANDRWYRQHEGAAGDVQLAAGDAFYSARTDTWATYYRMVLAGADAELAALAEQAITAASDIVHAPDKQQEHQLREKTADLITQFAVTAATRLRMEP
jgi:hypothetical protein